MVYRLCVLLLVCLAQVWAASVAEQQTLFQRLSERTYHAEKAEDADGNIIFVCFNQHPTFSKERPDAPGLSDADMALLSGFPALRGITLQFQPLSNAGYQVLAQFPQLEVASLCDVASHGKKLGLDWNFLDALHGAQQLRVLDLTHSFNMPKGGAQALERLGPFPNLHTLVVDVGLSDAPSELVAFIERCPRIERIKLHRTTLSEADFARVFAALPHLSYLEIKPSGNTPGERWSYQSLRLVAQQSNLTHLRLMHQDALPLPWQNGLEHLVNAKHLRYLQLPDLYGKSSPNAVRPEDLEALRAARPDLEINQRSIPPNPVAYTWEIGPR